jgi:acetyl-CoA acetyltransferase family protein
MDKAVIVDAVRTPVGRRGGALKDVHPVDLGGFIVRTLLEENEIDSGLVDDVVFGCVTQTDQQGGNIARQVALAAGFGVELPGVSVNRMCGSGQQAVNFAAQGVASGFEDVIVAGGVECMTRVPIMTDQNKPEQVSPTILEKWGFTHQGQSAEMIADKWDLSREDLDTFALESHQRAVAAIDDGRFKEEIRAIEVPQEDGQVLLFSTDEHPRRDTSIEKLASLKPAFKENGKVTAGNSSGINDAAAALLITRESVAKENGWPVRATIEAQALAGVDPVIMLTGPIPATQRILKRTGMDVDDVDLFECNEAFASVPLAWEKELGIDHAKVNVNGGAIALGHPLGATGARLLTTLLHELERTKKDVGVSTMCIGWGQGIATVIRRT